jgi:hypothetical protein
MIPGWFSRNQSSVAGACNFNDPGTLAEGLGWQAFLCDAGCKSVDSSRILYAMTALNLLIQPCSLESTRAQLLQVPLNEPLRDPTGPFNNVDYVVTCRAERKLEGDIQHILSFDTGEAAELRCRWAPSMRTRRRTATTASPSRSDRTPLSGTTAISLGPSRSSCPDAVVPRQGTKGCLPTGAAPPDGSATGWFRSDGPRSTGGYRKEDTRTLSGPLAQRHGTSAGIFSFSRALGSTNSQRNRVVAVDNPDEHETELTERYSGQGGSRCRWMGCPGQRRNDWPSARNWR